MSDDVVDRRAELSVTYQEVVALFHAIGVLLDRARDEMRRFGYHTAATDQAWEMCHDAVTDFCMWGLSQYRIDGTAMEPAINEWARRKPR